MAQGLPVEELKEEEESPDDSPVEEEEDEDLDVLKQFDQFKQDLLQTEQFNAFMEKRRKQKKTPEEIFLNFLTYLQESYESKIKKQEAVSEQKP